MLVRVIVVLIVIVMTNVMTIMVALTKAKGLRLRSFDDLFEFATIKPNAAALWAVVNFYSLLIGNH